MKTTFSTQMYIQCIYKYDICIYLYTYPREKNHNWENSNKKYSI